MNEKVLHKRVAELEAALRAASSPSHPLLQKGVQFDPESTGAPRGFGKGDSPTVVTRDGWQHGCAGEKSVDRLSSYSHLVVGEEPGRSRYYGAASSVYLTVCGRSALSGIVSTAV